MFPSLRAAQAELDQWVQEYNTARPHQSLDGRTPAERFTSGSADQPPRPPRPPAAGAAEDRSGSDWVSRRVASNGVICISWQQISVGVSHTGANVDVHLTGQTLQIWRDQELIKTVARTSRGEVRKKNASVQDARTGRTRT